MLRAAVMIAAMCMACESRAQSLAFDIESSTDPEASSATAEAVNGESFAASEWSFSFSAYAYIVPDEEDYIQPTLSIDRDWLHLEARYNYEDFDTASLWVGYNFSFGDELTLDITPMIGGVFGDTDGVAPGYEITLAWGGLELYTEGEFVFDAHDSSDSFFYSWSELTYAPMDWLRAGIVAQRTRMRGEDSDIDIGPLVGVTFEPFDFRAMLLFPEHGDPTVVLGFSVEF